MIEPVFVGLLAAAFAFMYPQFWAMLSNMCATILANIESPDFEEKVKKVIVGRKKYEGQGGVDIVRGEMVSMVASLTLAPIIPLVLYLVSLIVVVYGYHTDDAGYALGGVVILLLALGFCVGFLCFAFIIKWLYLQKTGLEIQVGGMLRD